MALWVKICGVTRAEDALAAFAAGADAIGLNFWPRSKRYVTTGDAARIVAALPKNALVYGVFVDAPRDEIARIVGETGIRGVQLHGDEAPAEAEGWDLPVIRAVAASSRERVTEALAWARTRSGIRVLVDHASGGGSGKTVDPALLEGLDLGDALVAGGLTPANVAAIVRRLSPFGVDTAGGVETAPGLKDATKTREFVLQARRGRENRQAGD